MSSPSRPLGALSIVECHDVEANIPQMTLEPEDSMTREAARDSRAPLAIGNDSRRTPVAQSRFRTNDPVGACRSTTRLDLTGKDPEGTFRRRTKREGGACHRRLTQRHKTGSLASGAWPMIGTWNVCAVDGVAAKFPAAGDSPIRDLSNGMCIAEIVRPMDVMGHFALTGAIRSA